MAGVCHRAGVVSENVAGTLAGLLISYRLTQQLSYWQSSDNEVDDYLLIVTDLPPSRLLVDELCGYPLLRVYASHPVSCLFDSITRCTKFCETERQTRKTGTERRSVPQEPAGVAVRLSAMFCPCSGLA